MTSPTSSTLLLELVSNLRKLLCANLKLGVHVQPSVTGDVILRQSML